MYRVQLSQEKIEAYAERRLSEDSLEMFKSIVENAYATGEEFVKIVSYLFKPEYRDDADAWVCVLTSSFLEMVEV